MRYIKRFSEPNILVNKKQEWTAKFIASNKNRPDSSKYAHPDIKDKLFTMSHHKCFYCETLVKDEKQEVDHFIEISEERQLAFDWDNLYLSCRNCNRKIPNKDISVAEVLNPCVDSDQEIRSHLKFEEELIKFLTPKGEKTIQKFRLNTDKLDHLRLKKLEKLMQTIMEINNIMIVEGRQAMNEDEKDILRRFMRNDRAYSLMFTQYLDGKI